MALKTSLPSTKRLFVIFALLAFAMVVVIFAISPQASQVSLYQTTGPLSGTLTLNGSTYCLKTSNGTQFAIQGLTRAVSSQLAQYVSQDVTVQGVNNSPFGYIPQNPTCLQNQFIASSIAPTSSTPQVSKACPVGGTKMDIVFVIDDSGTMNDNIIDRSGLIPSERPDNQRPDNLMKAFMPKEVAQLLAGNDQAGIVTFSDPVKTRQAVTTDLNGIVSSASAMTFSSDGSSLAPAIQTASDLLKTSRRSEANVPLPGVVIILADSRDISVATAATTVAKQDAAQNIRYYTIDLGGDGSKLKALATAGGGVSYTLTKPDQIAALVSKLTTEIGAPFNTCVSVKLQSDKAKIRKSGKANFTYTITNNSRRLISSAVLNQTLPDAILGPTNQQVTLVVGDLKPGESRTSTVAVSAKK